ncbi:MAG: hypothetical protein ACJAZS_000094 [Alteromonas naphthalenivorans]|jgi:hypothetical protein
MLLWLQQRLPKKHSFLFKLSILSVLTHAILCFGLFFMYKDYQHDLLLKVHAKHNPDNVIVRLLPLSAKKLKALKRITKSGGVSVRKQAKKIVQKKQVTQLAQVKKVVLKPKPKPVIAKKVVEAIKPKPVVKPVEKIIKQEQKKIIEKKEEPKPVVKPVEQVAKQEEKTAESLDTNAHKLASTRDELNKKPVLDQGNSDIKELDPVIEQVEENVRYVTHKELRGIELESVLQAAVQEVWEPPIGVHQDVTSEVQVTVGWDGKLIESKVITLSDIVIYDVAVQEALEEIKFPRQVWGKAIKIAFRP